LRKKTRVATGRRGSMKNEALSYKNWKWRPHNCAESFWLWDLRYSNYRGDIGWKEKGFLGNLPFVTEQRKRQRFWSECRIWQWQLAFPYDSACVNVNVCVQAERLFLENSVSIIVQSNVRK
jgi:hypothetical protein